MFSPRFSIIFPIRLPSLLLDSNNHYKLLFSHHRHSLLFSLFVCIRYLLFLNLWYFLEQRLFWYTLNKNHRMDETNPWSRCCKGNSLSNEGIFMILLSQYFPGWIKRCVLVHFSKGNTVEVGLEGNSLVKSTRYLIVISFQGGTFCPNRPVFNLMILYQ